MIQRRLEARDTTKEAFHNEQVALLIRSIKAFRDKRHKNKLEALLEIVGVDTSNTWQYIVRVCCMCHIGDRHLCMLSENSS